MPQRAILGRLKAIDGVNVGVGTVRSIELKARSVRKGADVRKVKIDDIPRESEGKDGTEMSGLTITRFIIRNPVMELEISIGQKLKENRRKRGESLKAVAKLSGISATTIRRIERGDGDYRLRTLFKLCRYYRIDTISLFK